MLFLCLKPYLHGRLSARKGQARATRGGRSTRPPLLASLCPTHPPPPWGAAGGRRLHPGICMMRPPLPCSAPRSQDPAAFSPQCHTMLNASDFAHELNQTRCDHLVAHRSGQNLRRLDYPHNTIRRHSQHSPSRQPHIFRGLDHHRHIWHC